MEPMDADKGRHEKGYHGYRTRDDRSDRDRTHREDDSRSSSSQRNPFSGRGGGGGYGNGGGGGYGNGGGGGYGNGGGRDRGNGGDRYSSGNGGDRYGSGNGGDRYGSGNGGDRYGSGNGGARYGSGNGGYGGGNGHKGNGGRGNDYRGGGGDRSRSGSSGGSGGGGNYVRGGSTESGGSGGSRQHGGKRAPSREREGSSKRQAGPSRSFGRSQDDKSEKKERRDRYEIIRTVPETFTSKKGTMGQPLRLRANYFELVKRPEYEMVMYRIDFEPEVELAAKRKYLMFSIRDLFGSYLYDTKNSVYLTHRLRDNVTIREAKDREENSYKITIKFGTIVSMDTRESLQVLNLILRRAMEGLKLQLIGRNLFDALAKVDFHNYHIQLWPGYTTSIRQHEQSVLLCAEIASKIMRNETVYDILRNIGQDGDFQYQFKNEVIGMVVLTDYNNKTYRIDDVDFGASPSDTFETKAGPISFVEYYRTKYHLTIRNPTQPMLITKSTERQRRGGQEEIISLIPELCRPTGLTDQQRNNFQLMKAIADHTRMDPRKRMMALDKFNKRLQTTDESQKILKSWNLKLDTKLVSIDGRLMKNENICYGNGVKEPTGQFADWQMAFKNQSMYLSYPLRNWVILTTRRMQSQVQNFVRMIEKASRQMNFEVAPAYIMEVDDKTQAYLHGMDGATKRNPQLIMAFVSNNNADRYASIKKVGCCDFGIPTQVIVQKTLNNKSLMSIATKVAIQLNCKLGGTPWLIEVPVRGLMTIGIDVSKDNRDKKVKWGALVASMDLKNVQSESFFSCVSKYSNYEDFSTQLPIDITKALKAYQAHHQAYPEKICIYRDGVGEGQIKFVFETELAQIKQRLEEMYSQMNAQLKLVFVIVSKKTNTRIFGADQRNPPPGTVIDDVITLPESYDFIMIPQTVRQGTVSPTSYNVLYDSLQLPPDRLQQLTYKQCHLYYNWAGTVRVPAVCQFAHKLTFLVAQFLHQVPSTQLEKKLYFL